MLDGEHPARASHAGLHFVCDQQGHWWLLEFNADTPSGVREAIVVDRLVFDLWPGDRLRRPSDQLARSLVVAFQGALAQAAVGPGEALGLAGLAHRAKKWTRFFAINDALFIKRSIGSDALRLSERRLPFSDEPPDSSGDRK